MNTTRMGLMQVPRAAAAAALLLCAPRMATAQAARPDSSAFIVVNPDDVKYAATGISQQIIFGDPSKPGFYVIRIRFAPGQTSKPHTHDQDRYVTVIKGTWWIALGATAAVFDTSRMVPMKPGSFVKHPAGAIHYDGAKGEEAIVQIMGMGPVKTIDATKPPGTSLRKR